MCLARSGSLSLSVEVVEELGAILGGIRIAAQALVEDGAAADGQSIVLAYGESVGEKGVLLDEFVELVLGIGDDLTGTALLIGESTILESDDGCRSTDGSDVLLSLVAGSAMQVKYILVPYGALTLNLAEEEDEVSLVRVGLMTKVPSKFVEHPGGV